MAALRLHLVSGDQPLPDVFVPEWATEVMRTSAEGWNARQQARSEGLETQRDHSWTSCLQFGQNHFRFSGTHMLSLCLISDPGKVGNQETVLKQQFEANSGKLDDKSLVPFSMMFPLSALEAQQPGFYAASLVSPRGVWGAAVKFSTKVCSSSSSMSAAM